MLEDHIISTLVPYRAASMPAQDQIFATDRSVLSAQ
jgi:hypothetical protein